MGAVLPCSLKRQTLALDHPTCPICRNLGEAYDPASIMQMTFMLQEDWGSMLEEARVPE